MKFAVFSVIFFGIFYTTPPAGPATAPNPDYPVHIHIFIAKATGGNNDYHGFGRGDILDAANPQGFDYTFECSQPFLNNRLPAEFYQAKWKKPNQEVQILLQPIGSDHTNHCDLKVALKAKPYGAYASTSAPASATGNPAASAPAREVHPQ